MIDEHILPEALYTATQTRCGTTLPEHIRGAPGLEIENLGPLDW
jgi:hypothetical protein